MTRVAIVVALLLIAWLVAGRQIAAFIDRVIPAPAASLPASPLRYDGGGFVIGNVPMVFASLDNRRLDLRLTFDPTNRVILSRGRDSFILGPRTNPEDPSGRPEIDFTTEPGDELAFTRRRSLVSWPTPFEIRIIGGRAPWWKRYVYYRFTWKKRSGAKLEMLWRYEQQYYSAGGWTAPNMMWNSQTALLSLEIQPESAGMEGAVVRYIVRTKGWHRGEYRIEDRGPAADGRSETFAVIHLEDERGAQPGAGRSVLLSLDPASNQVTKEVGWQ